MSCIIAKTVTYVSSLTVTYVTTLYSFPSRLTITIYVLNMKAARILSQKSEKGCGLILYKKELLARFVCIFAPQGAKIEVRLGPALAGSARPRRI